MELKSIAERLHLEMQEIACISCIFYLLILYFPFVVVTKYIPL